MASSRRSKPADRQPQSQPASADTRPTGSAAAEPAPSMLDDVVAETSELLTTPQDLPSETRAALINVARQFAGQPLALDPAGTALVEALLRTEFPVLAERPPLLARTARAIAQSLLNDPDARLRVEHLWAQLGEESA